MIPRPCLDCGINAYGTRCPACERIRQRLRNAARTQYHGSWNRLSKAARKATPWCARCGTTLDLTLDHETGHVECRSCNSSHRRNV